MCEDGTHAVIQTIVIQCSPPPGCLLMSTAPETAQWYWVTQLIQVICHLSQTDSNKRVPERAFLIISLQSTKQTVRTRLCSSSQPLWSCLSYFSHSAQLEFHSVSCANILVLNLCHYLDMKDKRKQQVWGQNNGNISAFCV